MQELGSACDGASLFSPYAGGVRWDRWWNPQAVHRRIESLALLRASSFLSSPMCGDAKLDRTDLDSRERGSGRVETQQEWQLPVKLAKWPLDIAI